MSRYEYREKIERSYEIVEDTITRNRKFQEKRQAVVDRLIKLNAPREIIELEQEIANMTLAEYQLMKQEESKIAKEKREEYIRKTPLRKEVVDEIYKIAESAEYNPSMCESYYFFNMYEISKVGSMKSEEFYNDLYIDFVKNAHESYVKKYENEYALYQAQQKKEEEEWKEREKLRAQRHAENQANAQKNKLARKLSKQYKVKVK